MSHSNRLNAGARAMMAVTMAQMKQDEHVRKVDSGPAIVIRKVNYKLKAKNRAARHEKNRQNKRMRHAA
jgi:hypothetical protein